MYHDHGTAFCDNYLHYTHNLKQAACRQRIKNQTLCPGVCMVSIEMPFHCSNSIIQDFSLVSRLFVVRGHAISSRPLSLLLLHLVLSSFRFIRRRHFALLHDEPSKVPWIDL